MKTRKISIRNGKHTSTKHNKNIKKRKESSTKNNKYTSKDIKNTITEKHTPIDNNYMISEIFNRLMCIEDAIWLYECTYITFIDRTKLLFRQLNEKWKFKLFTTHFKITSSINENDRPNIHNVYACDCDDIIVLNSTYNDRNINPLFTRDIITLLDMFEIFHNMVIFIRCKYDD